MNTFSFNRITILMVLVAAVAGRLGAQSCGTQEFNAQKIIFKSEQLPVELSGFFPYEMSGMLPAQKYTTESWVGTGEAGNFACGCFVGSSDIVWSGSWTFSTTEFSDVSDKSLNWVASGCPYPGGPAGQTASNLKVGLADPGGGLASPGVTTLEAASRTFSEPGAIVPPSSCFAGNKYGYTTVTETLATEFTHGDALSRAETYKTIAASGRQYWDNDYPVSADHAAYLLGQGLILRTTPIVCHAERVSFQAQFNVSCMGQGKYIVTAYYKKWQIGDPEPEEYITRSEEVTFQDGPYLWPKSGYIEYPFDLKQGEQCTLVRVTARPLEQCADRAPGDSSGTNSSVDMLFFLGRRSDGSGVGALTVTGSAVSPVLYTPAGLQLLAGDSPEMEVIKSGDDLRQIKAPETFADIVTLSASSYKIDFYLPSQVGSISSGIYSVSGTPYVSYLVENPDSGGTNQIRFTEARGSMEKVTLYAYDSGSGTLTMASGNGLRSEALARTVSGSTVTETRTIKDANDQTVSVVREVKQIFAFSENVIQRVLDPDGANLSTTYSYYENPVSDGGNYGQVKLMIEPSGRWTRYTYDSVGRPAATVTQFLDTASGSPDSSNRMTSITYGTIPDEDGDSTPEKLTTTVQSLLGQETGRSYEVVFSQLGTAYGADVETRWDITCTSAGVAWDAASNLVTQRRVIVSGDWFGKPISALRPDGTLTTWNYSADSTHLTTTTLAGEANVSGTAVVAGTRTVLVETLFGQMVSSDAYDYPSNTLLTSQVVSLTDPLGRPTRIDHLDGTHELRSYACCGLDMLTDRQGIATNYQYNDLGQVDRETRAGIAQSRELDPDGRVLSVTRIGSDSSQITTESHQYDLAGRLAWSKDALDRQTSFSEAIDGSGHTVRTTTNPDTGTIVQVYAKDGSLLSVSGNAAPQKLAYEYGVDADGSYTKEIHVGSSGETTEWVKSCTDVAGRTYKRVYADSAAEQSYFNELGQLVRQVDADGVATLFAYNGKGEQEVTALDLNGNGVIDYDDTDRITRTQNVVGTHDSYVVQRATTESWETDGVDTPVSVSVVESTFDGLRSWQTVRGLITASATTLDGTGGRTVATSAPDGTVTTQVFSNDRLLSQVTSRASLGNLASVSYSYDPHGRLQTSIDLRNGTTSFTYLADDQIHTVITPDPDTAQTGDGYDPQTTIYGYDDAGRPNLVTQPDATVVNTSYWPAGQVKRTWGSRTYPVEYSYDSQGRVKTLTTWQDFAGSGGAAVTTWNYNSQRGWLDSKRYNDNTGPSYTYYPSGRLHVRNWARGTTTTYSYTGGDLTGVDYSDSTPDVTLQYDRLGRPKTISDASGTRALTYDVSAQLEDEDYSSGLLSGLGVHRTFDAQARLDTLSVGSLYSAGYTYDSASRLNTVTSGSNTATYAYVTNSSLVESITFKQGGTTRLTTTKDFDKLNRLKSISSSPGVGAALSFAYGYNSANQRTRATREDDAYWSYGYDSLGQVNSAVKKLAGGTPVLGFEHAWSFDDIGNRKNSTINGQTATYTPNLLNQYSQRTVPAAIDVMGTAVADADVLVNEQAAARQDENWHQAVAVTNSNAGSWVDVNIAGVRAGAGPGGADAVAMLDRSVWVPKTPEAFSHDGDGNLKQDGRWTYTWDGENRLVGMQTRADILPPFGVFPLSENRKLDFGYDSQGRRIFKKVSSWTGGGWELVSSVLFLYDGWNMIAELNALSANVPLRTYVWGLDLAGSMQGAGGVGGLLIANTAFPEGSAHAVAFDGNGNVGGYVDLGTGVRSATFEYSGFGETLVADGPAQNAFPFRFSTKFTDGETGQLYYGHRYYNPSMGRWLNPDPTEERGGINLFGFINNDACNSIDRVGLDPVITRAPGFDDLVKPPSPPPPPLPGVAANGWQGALTPPASQGKMKAGEALLKGYAGWLKNKLYENFVNKGIDTCRAAGKPSFACACCCVIEMYTVPYGPDREDRVHRYVGAALLYSSCEKVREHKRKFGEWRAARPKGAEDATLYLSM